MALLPNAIALVALLLLVAVEGAIIEQTWNIAYKFVEPDGVEKLVPVVNDQYPGPDLVGNVGDKVRITVVNKLPTETTTIHWHGIKQSGTPWSDGVPGISQCPILPGDSFVYEFELDAPGTLWWHSHSGLQKSSLYGVIIVKGDEGKVQPYKKDVVMLLNDWFHKSSNAQIAGLVQPVPNFRWVGDAQSLLFNGRGAFNCSATVKACNATAEDSGPEVIDVVPGETYRLRLVGASSLSFLNFGIDSHNITMIEAETTLLQPFDTDFLDLGAGQSYSALLKAHTKEQLDAIAPGHNGLFWMQLNVRHRTKGERGLAILRYSFADKSKQARPSRAVPTSPGKEDIRWSLAHVRRFKSLEPSVVPEADRRFVYLGTQNNAADGRLVWALNNISYADPPPETPILHAAKFNIQSEIGSWVEQTTIPTPFNYSQTLSKAGLSTMARTGPQVLKIKKDEVIEFVFQNTLSLGGDEEIHPWHLHLHNFYVLAHGDHESTWSESDVESYDLQNALFRNTMVLFPLSWTVVRFKADNAGAAHFHCHILPHLVMGMGFVLNIGESNEIPGPPAGTPICGAARDAMARSDPQEASARFAPLVTST